MNVHAAATAAFILSALTIASTATAAGQQRLERPLRVYMDCANFGCDRDFLTQQVAWVDFVRDRQSADVHVLGTRQRTGAGGFEISLEFIGRDTFAGARHVLTHTVPADVTDDEERRELVRATRLGLASFAATTPLGGRIDVEFDAGARPAAAAPRDDPWDFWVFEAELDGWIDGESQQQEIDLRGAFSANRTTAAWKTGAAVYGSVSRDEFELEDSTTLVSTRESFGTDGIAVRSVSPHWSTGAVGSWSRNTFRNYDASLYAAPAIEYSVYPYAESTRRVLTVLYAIGPRYYDYADITLFGETSESLIEQMLAVSYDVTQPWGQAGATAELSHFLAKISGESEWAEPQYGVDVRGGFDIRLLRGLSTELEGGFELVRNQIQLAAGGLTDEERLTQQRELATDHRYWASVGFSYRFGSIYSTVVNPRFDWFD